MFQTAQTELAVKLGRPQSFDAAQARGAVMSAARAAI
jgi:hypothetical protein